MDGGTYSPREVEIIDAKYKLDQLAAVADLEVKQEKINRWVSVWLGRLNVVFILEEFWNSNS